MGILVDVFFPLFSEVLVNIVKIITKRKVVRRTFR